MHLRHQSWPTTGLSLHDDSYVVLEELVEEAKNRDAGLIFPGDIFDHGISVDVPKNLQELQRITRGFGQILYTVGNHDRTGGTAGAVNPEWVEILNEKYPHADELGEHLIGDDWLYEEGIIHEVRGIRFACIHHAGTQDDFEAKLYQLLDANNHFDVLICHQAMKELLGVYGAYEFDLELVGNDLHARDCHTVIAGHVHTPESWVWQDKITVVSPGESYPKTLTDSMAKRYPILHFEEGRDVEVEWKEFERIRRIEHVVATDEEEYGHAIKTAEGLRKLADAESGDPRIRKPVLSMKYVATPGFKANIQNILEDKVALFEFRVGSPKMARATIETLVQDTVSLDATLDEISSVTALHTMEGPVRDDLIRIQNGEDPAAVIEERIGRETA